MTYITLNTLIYLTRIVSGGRLVPLDEDYRDYWTCKWLQLLRTTHADEA